MIVFLQVPAVNGRPFRLPPEATISACEKGAQWQRAVWLLHTAEKEKLRPGEVSVSFLLKPICYMFFFFSFSLRLAGKGIDFATGFV